MPKDNDNTRAAMDRLAGRIVEQARRDRRPISHDDAMRRARDTARRVDNKGR